MGAAWPWIFAAIALFAAACQPAMFEAASIESPEGDLLTKEFCSPERIDYFRLRGIYGDEAVYFLSRAGKGRFPAARFAKEHDAKASLLNELIRSSAPPESLNEALRPLVRFMAREKMALPQEAGPDHIQNYLLNQIGGGYRHYAFSAVICVYLRQDFQFSEKGKDMIRRHASLTAERNRLLKIKPIGILPWRETEAILSRIGGASGALSKTAEELMRLREGFQQAPRSYFQPQEAGADAEDLLDGSHHDENFYCVKGCLYEKERPK